MSFKKTKLLTTNNIKTMKGEKVGYMTFILYMSPFKQNSAGINLCSHASAGCAAACLFGSGFGGMYTNVENGRINKTEYFLADRKAFLEQLDKEVTNAEIKAKKAGMKIAIRLNGTTDIRFEKFVIKDNKNIFELHPRVQFYDYTKNHIRFDTVLPKNYHLTFSRSENNEAKAIELLNRGYNVAMVFDTLPKEYKGFKIINGDNNDLRFKDKKGVIVGLSYKLLTKKGADNNGAFVSGFAIRTKPEIPLSMLRGINKKLLAAK